MPRPLRPVPLRLGRRDHRCRDRQLQRFYADGHFRAFTTARQFHNLYGDRCGRHERSQGPQRSDDRLQTSCGRSRPPPPQAPAPARFGAQPRYRRLLTVVTEVESISGVKFTSSQNGYITGIRFYKSAANTGTHVGSIWTTAGVLLGSVNFTGESASGWQQATFTTPIAVTAGTTYVASYLAPTGHYSDDSAYFTSEWYDKYAADSPFKHSDTERCISIWHD